MVHRRRPTWYIILNLFKKYIMPPTYGTQDGCNQNTDTPGRYHHIRYPQDKDREIKHLKNVLSVAGYSKWAWQTPGRKKIRPHPRITDHERAKAHVTLPYIGSVTEPISRLIRKTGIAAHTKPHTTIRSILVAPKGKDHPQDKCGVVYQLTCHYCEVSYIGETGRALKQRLKEHQKDSSPVGHNMGYNKHKVDSQNIRIIDRDSRCFQRGVREAIQIRSRSSTVTVAGTTSPPSTTPSYGQVTRA